MLTSTRSGLELLTTEKVNSSKSLTVRSRRRRYWLSFVIVVSLGGSCSGKVLKAGLIFDPL